MTAERNELDVSSPFQGLSKEMDIKIGFPIAQQSQCFGITYSVFKMCFI